MAADEYVPNESEVRASYVIGETRDGEGSVWEDLMPDARAEFDRFLAHVRKDAAREALDGLIAWHRENAQDAETPAPIRRGIAVMADEAQRYRDTHYPEESP